MLALLSQSPTMATTTSTVTTVRPQHAQADDIATRLRNGTLHSGYPPIEQYMTIDGLLKSHAAQSDEGCRPLICYPIRGAADFEEHTAGQLDRYTEIATRFYTSNGLLPAVSARTNNVSNLANKL